MMAIPDPPVLPSLANDVFPDEPSNTNRNAEMASSHSPYPSHPFGLYPPNTIPLVDSATKSAAPCPSHCVWKLEARQPCVAASYAMPRGMYSNCVCFNTFRIINSSSVSSEGSAFAAVPSQSAGH